MCNHDDFTIIHYRLGVIIRKCKVCGKIEISTEGWVDTGTVIDALIVLNKLIGGK